MSGVPVGGRRTEHRAVRDLGAADGDAGVRPYYKTMALVSMVASSAVQRMATPRHTRAAVEYELTRGSSIMACSLSGGRQWSLSHRRDGAFGRVLAGDAR